MFELLYCFVAFPCHCVCFGYCVEKNPLCGFLSLPPFPGVAAGKHSFLPVGGSSGLVGMTGPVTSDSDQRVLSLCLFDYLLSSQNKPIWNTEQRLVFQCITQTMQCILKYSVYYAYTLCTLCVLCMYSMVRHPKEGREKQQDRSSHPSGLFILIEERGTRRHLAGGGTGHKSEMSLLASRLLVIVRES